MEQPKRIYTTIRIKRRVAGQPGPPPSLQPGELAMNEIDHTLYIGTTETLPASGNTITDLGTF